MYAAWRASPVQGRFPGTGDAILNALHTIAPDEGRRLVLSEIATGERGIATTPSRRCPIATSPIWTRVSRDALHTAGRLGGLHPGHRPRHDRLAHRALRFSGTRTLCPRRPDTRTIELRPGGGPGSLPVQAQPRRGRGALEPPLDRRGGCVDPWRLLAERYWDPRVEALAVQRLMTSDVSRVSRTAEIPARPRLERRQVRAAGSAEDLVRAMARTCA